jgi:DNA-binding transcriptional LysR family regulator
MKFTTIVASLSLTALLVVNPAFAASTSASMKEADALQAKAGQEAGWPAYSPGKGVTFKASDHVYIKSALAVDFTYRQASVTLPLYRGLSPDGKDVFYISTLEPAPSEIQGALDELDRSRDVVTGVVRLTMTRHAFETVIRPVLSGFLDQHPGVQVEVLIDYQLRDIVAERFDAGIRIGEKLEKDMIAVGVGPELRMAFVASPSYLARHALPQNPQELTRHRCVNYRLMASGKTYAWEFERGGRVLELKVEGPLAFNEPELMLEAALDGLGVSYILEELAGTYLSSGQLVRLFSDWTAPFPGYFLYYPSRRQVPAALAAFVAALRCKWSNGPASSAAGVRVP